MCLRSLSLVPECWNIVETVISSCGKPFTDLDNGVEGWSDAIYNSMWVRHVGTFCTNTLHPAVHNISQLWYVFSHYFIKLLWFFFFIFISRFDLETFVKKENLTQHKTASFYDHVIKNRYATDVKTWITHILLKGVHSARKFSVSLHVLFSNVTGLYE